MACSLVKTDQIPAAGPDDRLAHRAGRAFRACVEARRRRTAHGTSWEPHSRGVARPRRPGRRHGSSCVALSSSNVSVFLAYLTVGPFSTHPNGRLPEAKRSEGGAGGMRAGIGKKLLTAGIDALEKGAANHRTAAPAVERRHLVQPAVEAHGPHVAHERLL